MKDLIARFVMRFIKAIKLPEVWRFKILYWGYRLLSPVHTRNAEWDFVLNYLPPLKDGQRVNVLDVGSTGSLLLFIIAKRGYDVTGADIRPYEERLLPNMSFFNCGINDIPLLDGTMDYITVVSVIAHLGTSEYGSEEYISGDQKAIKKFAKLLKQGRKLLITTPTDIFIRRYWGKACKFRGYSYLQFKELVEDYFDIQECIERKGQLLACCVRR